MVTEGATLRAKLQALVYDILPSTTAVFSYAIASRKNCQLRSIFILFYFLMLRQ